MTEDDRKSIFAVSGALESPMTTAGDIFCAIGMMAETFDSKEGAALQRLAWLGAGALKEAETLRCRIYRLSHANPEIRRRAK